MGLVASVSFRLDQFEFIKLGQVSYVQVRSTKLGPGKVRNCQNKSGLLYSDQIQDLLS